jgi:hypothetical protein
MSPTEFYHLTKAHMKLVNNILWTEFSKETDSEEEYLSSGNSTFSITFLRIEAAA